MATITAAKAGNWSDTAVWNGGAVPGNGDTADLNNYAITMDIATIPASGSLLGITDASATGTGYLAVPMNTLAANCAINVNYSGATGIVATKNTTALIQVTGTATSYKLTITSNITGGSVTDGKGVYLNGTSDIEITGDIAGGSALRAHGLNINDTSYYNVDATISGSCSGGSGKYAYGLCLSNVKTCAVSGNVTGGAGELASGIFHSMALTVDGDISGGNGLKAPGISCGDYQTSLTFTGKLIDGTGGPAIASKLTPTWTNDGSKYWQVAITEGTVKFGREPAAGKLYTGIVCGSTTGTLTVPAVAKVISDTSYGAGGTEYTGTYHEALPAEVLDTVMFGASSGVAGTYHEATAAEVQKDVTFGPASGYTGTYDPMAAAVFPDEADTWHGTGAYGPNGNDYTPAMVGSDIPNLEAGNIKSGVTVDDVLGTYAGGGGGAAPFNGGFQ